jgi:2-(1,2-epoxy-1,2-dihydrophenyl)acetyl-CoA isomerase
MESAVSDTLIIERRDALAIITLNLPEKRNALGPALSQQLSRVLLELQDEPDIRALVLSGGRHFCAGGDLAGIDSPALAMQSAMQIGQRTVRALTGGRLPSVAAVEGSAFGAGFSLALACDFVVADENTTFCAAFGRVGLTPDYGLLCSLPQREGVGLAREILMFCEPIRGVQARELRLVDRLAEPGKVLDTAIELAQRLAAASPGTIATTKSVLSRLPLSLDTMLAWEADTQSLLLRSEDFAEGVRAFSEKREPRFQGR